MDEQCKKAYFNSQSLTGLQRQYLNLIIDAGGGIDTVSLWYNEIQIVGLCFNDLTGLVVGTDR